VEGFLRLMDAADDFTGPVNLGNPGEFTILELAEKVIEMVGSGSKIAFKDLPMDDPTRRRPDISLAEKELGWKPTIDLDAGLRRTVDYFDALLSSGV
jgi:UDP-glucuronate decarboxylase